MIVLPASNTPSLPIHTSTEFLGAGRAMAGGGYPRPGKSRAIHPPCAPREPRPQGHGLCRPVQPFGNTKAPHRIEQKHFAVVIPWAISVAITLPLIAMSRTLPFFLALQLVVASQTGLGAPALRFQAGSPVEARRWQQDARNKLFTLMMGGSEPVRGPLHPKVLRREQVAEGAYVLEEITLQTVPGRQVHAWLARPLAPRSKVGAVLAIHGHGGSGEEVVRGQSLYWYGKAMAEMGYVVIAPDVGQHTLQFTNWTLMGERTWDALRCLDYVVTLPEVDADRLAVAGLSLGGETTMYVAALDERVKAVCSSGWLTTVANMKNGHCPCFNFPGLEEHFDFSDIFACVAPRLLVCELGEMERAPGGFPVAIGRQAMHDIVGAYQVFGAGSNAVLTVHSGPHVFSGRDFLPALRRILGSEARPLPDEACVAAWVRFLEGPESLDGTPYYWLGRTALRLEFDVAPRPGDLLELGWGAKSDHRDATLTVNGRTLQVSEGGHWGFRWLRVPLPAGLEGSGYRIEITRGQGRPAFFSEARLVSPTRPAGLPADLKATAHRGRLTLLAEGEIPAGEAFPERRPGWDQQMPLPPSVSTDSETASFFREAEKNARLASEALFRCRRYVDGWLAHADPATGLIPRNLSSSRDFWNGRDAAADNYPYMVLTAAITDRPLLEGRLLAMLRAEERLTCRLDRLTDDYSFAKQGWRRETLDPEAVVFDSAEYVKDGLLPITEWLGPSPWSERMIGLVDDLWKHARVETPFGKVPTLNIEVCGDLLQANARLCWFTGDAKYLDWALRLGDYFLLGTNHPTRNLAPLRLVDHGCEVVNGLSELYVAAAYRRPDKKRAYEGPLREIFDTILLKGRNKDGLLYSWFDPKTGAHSPDLCDTWGYDYDGFYTLWLVDRIPAYREAVRQVLGNLHGKYVGACWGDKSADGYADSIEGAMNLLNREPTNSAVAWSDSQIRLMWAIQKPDGIIEGWHGDGNFARTSLLYALWKTQGTTVNPWRADVRFGAARSGKTLHVWVGAEHPWEGRLVFDQPRHKVFMRLPLDYPRINQFPEWFTVEKDARYSVAVHGEPAREFSGRQLIEGLAMRVEGGRPVGLTVQPRP